MPAFVKGKQGEKVWSEAKSSVHQSHPDLSEDDEQFWKIVTTIYKKRRPQDIKKKANTMDAEINRALDRLPTSARVALLGAPLAAAGALGLYSSYKNAAYMKHLEDVRKRSGATEKTPLLTKAVDATGQGLTNSYEDDFRRAFPVLYPDSTAKNLYEAAHQYGHSRDKTLSPLSRILLSASPYIAAAGSGLLARKLTDSQYSGALTGAGVGGLVGLFANHKLYEDERDAARLGAHYIAKSRASDAEKRRALRMLQDNQRNILRGRWLDIALPLTGALGTVGMTYLMDKYRPQLKELASRWIPQTKR